MATAQKKEKPRLAEIMYDEVWQLIVQHEEKEARIENNNVNQVSTRCDICEATPCMWLENQDRVLENDYLEHGHKLDVVNSTRRKIAFRYMFRVWNEGPGQKGVRKRLPECVEQGVRATMPDEKYMGFMEE